MRGINVNKIVPVVKKLCIDASIYIGDDVVEKLKEFQEKEESPIAKEIISIIFENQRLSVEKKMPLCQDTGVAIFFIDLGQDVHLVGGDFYDAINEGVRQ